MEAIYLQSMADFVLEREATSTFDTSKIDWYDLEQVKLDEIRNYARFLKQPLQLGFFVPTDLEGVLEKPLESDFDNFDLNEGGQVVDYELYNNACDEFLDAQEKVLFKGFEIRDKGNFYFVERKESTLFRRVLNKNTKSTIEDLLIWGNVELAETAIKQIGI